jgi:integrase
MSSKKKYTLTKYVGVFGYETAKGRRFARKVSGVRKPDGTKGDSWKGGFMTARDAREDRNQTLDQMRRGAYVRRTKIALGDYLTERWLPSQKGRLKKSAYASYAMIITKKLPGWLLNTPVAEIEGDDLDRLYAELLVSGREDGKGLAPKSVRNIHICLHKALEDACRKKLIVRNPADDSDPPKQQSPGSNEMKTWTSSQLNEFLSHVSGDRFRAAYLLAAMTGMRRGEILGLRLQDFDPPPVVSRYGTRSSASTTRSPSGRPRPGRVSARSPWTGRPWLRSRPTSLARPRRPRPTTTTTTA